MKLFIFSLLILTQFACEKPISSGRVISPINETSPLQPENPESPVGPINLVPIQERSSQLKSQLSRAQGVTQLSYNDEKQATQQNQLSMLDYYPTPKIKQSDDGVDASSPVNKQPLLEQECGVELGLSSIAHAMGHCARILPNSRWLGQDMGHSGEGNWRLVTRLERQGSNYEVWIDEQTGLLWSDVITQANWCKASGNREKSDDLCARQLDDAICGPQITSAAQGNLNSDFVAWRLPTRNDWLQADINGSRFVLPNNDQFFWTATVNSQNREQAWTYHLKTGLLRSQERGINEVSVRCVGTILR